MSDELVKPNLHVALVHFPIGLLLAGTLIELLSFMYRRHALRAAGRWMILLGALGGIPTAMAGIYALADVSLEYVPATGPWKELASESAVWQNHDQAHMLEDHLVLSAWGIGLAVLVSILWMGSSDVWRNRFYFPLLALLLIACGLVVMGAWHAGEAVYRYGTGVELAPVTQPSLADATEHDHSADLSGFKLAEAFPPVELHMILAGTTVAVALAAMGLSFRAANSGVPATQVDHIAAALGPAHETLSSDSEDSIRPEPPDISLRLPVARFWLLAVLIGALTALAGDWVLASGADTWNFTRLWELIKQPVENATYPWLTRRLAHLGGGVSIIVLSLVMAIVARLAPRARITLLVFAVLLLGAIAAQIWFGILLTFDSMQGPVRGFN